MVSVQLRALDVPAVLQPADLNPGETFYVVFNTDAVRDQNNCDGGVTTAFLDTQGTNAAAGSVTNGVAGWRSLYAHAAFITSAAVTSSVTAAGPAFNNVVDRPIYNVRPAGPGGMQWVANDQADLFDGSIGRRHSLACADFV